MKVTRLLATTCSLFIISCGTPDEKVDSSYYIESKLSFYDPYDESFTVGTWIRDPKNIRIAHESFKKFGYGKLFTDEELFESPCWIPGLHSYVTKSCNDIVDSLIIHYAAADTAPKYYREFWMRRKAEGTDSIVLEVLAELKSGVFGRRPLEIRDDFVNDTIVTLLEIQNVRAGEPAIQHFQFLKNVGLHMSAYNLLYERVDYYNVNWDRNELVKGLVKDTARCCPSAIFEDDTP